MENIIERRRYLRKHEIIDESTEENIDIVDRILNRIMFQVIIASYIIAIGALCKNIAPEAFYKVYNKYSWIIKEDMTITQMYNKSIIYINNKFDFNIPIVLETTSVNEQVESIQVTEKNITDIETNQEMLILEEEILGFDSMKTITDEIKQTHTFIKPTNGVITCPFGNRNSTSAKISSFHLGTDIANNLGTDIVASIKGTVEEVSSNSVYGKYVKIVNEDILTVYAHCSQTLVNKGDYVYQGQLIAKMGQTGLATGPHLHFELRKNGKVINPEYILDLE